MDSGPTAKASSNDAGMEALESQRFLFRVHEETVTSTVLVTGSTTEMEVKTLWVPFICVLATSNQRGLVGRAPVVFTVVQ